MSRRILTAGLSPAARILEYYRRVSDNWLGSGLLGETRQIVQRRECHVVGGAVRDHLLGREARDLDLVVAHGEDLTTRLADGLDARRIELGGDRFAAVRLVGSTQEGEAFVIDVWDRGDTPLEVELARRDFTINAIAVDLRDGRWHDPLAGIADLESRLLRACSEGAFREDPLRVLRLARLAAELPDLTVESDTLQLARDAAAGLSTVAIERRREEVGRALRADRVEVALEIWAEVGFFPEAFGGTRPRADALRTIRRVLARARALDRLLPEGEAVDRFALHSAVILAASDADLDCMLETGYFSRAEARRIAFVLPWSELPSVPSRQRWLLHRAASLWPTALLHAAAWDTARDLARTEALLGRCFRLARDERETIFDPEPLVRGDEIRQLLGLESGPEIGRLAKLLRRLQVEGTLNTRDEAIARLLSERRSSDADSAP